MNVKSTGRSTRDHYSEVVDTKRALGTATF